MSPTRVGCRYCQRPVPDDSPCGCCCFRCDDAPPLPRPGFPHPGLVASIGLALVVFGVAIGLLLIAFNENYTVQPSPDGPVVIERTR